MEVIKLSTKQLNICENDVILDIETTGFSPNYASIYMIGLIYFEKGEIKFEQFFATKKSDEYEILFRTFQIIENKNLYTFNGDSFDIRFMKSRASKFGLAFPTIKSIDLLKYFRQVKYLLGLENIKLKTVERFFGFIRDDQFTGGELIELYHVFLQDFDETLKVVILTHNSDDLLGLYTLYEKRAFILSLCEMVKGTHNVKLINFKVRKEDFLIEFENASDVDISFHLKYYDLDFKPNICTVRGPLYKGELKHFFKDYHNYYYIKKDDIAVHKSVGKYLDKSLLTRAKKENCYIKEKGIFLPATTESEFQLFKSSINSSESYVFLDEIRRTKKFESYLSTLLTLMKNE